MRDKGVHKKQSMVGGGDTEGSADPGTERSGGSVAQLLAEAGSSFWLL